tara:strand:+ start:597 stop:1274 length:678 start_codon:yes stop_codon:yes gene_type:complete
MPGPYKLSPSALNLLKDCPRCFWLNHNKGIRRPDGIFPSLPSGMDKVLKVHFDSFMEKGTIPPELKKEGVKVELFKDMELLSVWRNNRKGISWTDEEGNLFRGAVDNILVAGDKLVVLDYKTRGYPLKEDTHLHYKDQMDIYNFLLRKNGRKTEDYGYLLFYYPQDVNEKGDVVFQTRLIKLDVDVGNAESIFRRAIDVLNGPIPAATEDCKFCNWAVNYDKSCF